MNTEILNSKQLSNEDIELIGKINTLSSSAMFLAGKYHFGIMLRGQAVLLAPVNDDQEKYFQELLAVGFCHGDVERGVYGYRSTYSGREACGIIRAIYKMKDGML